jgi:hypothetical protein
MASITTIIIFLVLLWGLGFTSIYSLKKPDNPLERFFLTLGVGLVVFPILSILFNFLHIPLDWKIFLFVSLIYPIILLIIAFNKRTLRIPKFNLRLTKSTLIMIVVILIFSITLFMYTKGAFSYPYLEDEDPWGHSVGVQYVAIEKNAYDPKLNNTSREVDSVLSYVDPYPPAYDILMGLLNQTYSNTNWILKFFNALIISLGIIFFYLFSKDFVGDGNKALFATFVLAAIPSYLSHFIWAHSLVITLLFPTLYALNKIKEDERWAIITSIAVASIWVSQNVSQPIKLTTMLMIFILVGSITHKRFMAKEFLAVVSGILISGLWWLVMIAKYGLSGFIAYYVGSSPDSGTEVTSTISTSIFSKLGNVISALTSPGGTASRAYTFQDFFFAKSQNMINSPIGIGIVLSILTLLGIIYLLWRYGSSLVTKENTWICIILFWMVFTFWGVNGETFPISVARGAFRVWVIMTIPIAFISTEASFFLANLFKRFKLRWLIFGLIIIGILLTSAQQKYIHNTIIWPTSGTYTTPQEPFEYGAWFNSVPDDTRVFLYAPRDKIVTGYGKKGCLWCQETIDFRNNALYLSAQDIYDFLKNNKYEYFIINGRMDFKYFSSKFGDNTTNQILPGKYQEILGSGLFTPVHQVENNFIVLKVN